MTTSTSIAAPPESKPAATLSVAQYLGYGGGDAANNLTFSLTSMFLLVYYTDVAGIAAGAAGTVLDWHASGAPSRTSSPGGWWTRPIPGGAGSGRTSSSSVRR